MTEPMWMAADDIDKVLEIIWGTALDASRAEDTFDDPHKCTCGEIHGHTPEWFYLRKQRHRMLEARTKLDELYRGRSLVDREHGGELSAETGESRP